MKIQFDESYLKDKNLIAAGYARKGVYSFRLDAYVSEERKEQNRLFTDKVGLNSEEWKASCNEWKQTVANDNKKFLEILKHKIVIGQYEQDNRKNYDVWFWCNCRYNTGYATEADGNRDLSYVTLTVNNELTTEQRETVYNIVMETAKEINTENNRVIVQYQTIYDDSKIAETAQNFYKTITDKFIMFGGVEGKIKDYGEETAKYNSGNRYGFVKKRSRTAYQVSNAEMVNLYLSMNK